MIHVFDRFVQKYNVFSAGKIKVKHGGNKVYMFYILFFLTNGGGLRGRELALTRLAARFAII